MIHVIKRVALIVVAVVATGLFYTAPAAAQATRTWISGVGDDANPCSRTAPCKTFAGAISKTAGGGEINCLDPGGFGGVTITKSITLMCDMTESGVLVAATNAIIVNGSGVVVQINGLDIEGLGQTGVAGVNGIYFLNGASLTVRNTKIRGFRNGYGINFAPSANATLVIDNVQISESGIGSSSATGGILISPAAGITAQATITNTQVVNNINAGLRIDTIAVGAATAASAVVSNSVFANNTTGIQLKAPPGSGPARLMLANSVVSGNSTAGIVSNGTTSVGRVGGTVITGNGNALTLSAGGVLYSYGNNQLDGNTVDGAFTLPVIPTH
ncbi:MAG: right-handed parallel beta-helix repeat-containing protein [Pseudomonadota bacterium]